MDFQESHNFLTLLSCVCPWNWQCVYTAHIVVCLLLASPAYETSRSQSHHTIRTLRCIISMHKILAAVIGNVGDKSSDSDLIKHTWPTRWGAWMVHAPLSSHKPSRLGFSAPAACGQNHSGTLKSHQIDALHQRPVHVMAVTAVTGIFTLEIRT